MCHQRPYLGNPAASHLVSGRPKTCATGPPSCSIASWSEFMRPLGAIALGVFVCVACAGAGPAPKPEPDNKLLWRDPGPIGRRDLYWGEGSKAHAPRPPFTFVEENTSGNRPKLVVKDAAGVEWTAKFAPKDPLLNEVHAEIAATRIMWALGFFADENYFVPSG